MTHPSDKPFHEISIDENGHKSGYYTTTRAHQPRTKMINTARLEAAIYGLTEEKTKAYKLVFTPTGYKQVMEIAENYNVSLAVIIRSLLTEAYETMSRGDNPLPERLKAVLETHV